MSHKAEVWDEREESRCREATLLAKDDWGCSPQRDETLHVTRRLQDPLEQIQKRGCVEALLAQGIEFRHLPFGAIRGRSYHPFPVELHAFPVVVDDGPKLPARLGPWRTSAWWKSIRKIRS